MTPVLDKKSKKFFNKCGKKIFAFALDGFYYFEDDTVEDLLDKALQKFEKQPDWRKMTRAYVWSFQDIRNKICKVGYSIYAPREDDNENCDYEFDNEDS